jgi:4-methylaminobutanoate oxidase (formaldehyde-forming)
VFDQLISAGGDYGMKLAGAYAVDTLRLEKGFPLWGQDLDTETTPLEAGLEFAVDMNKVCRLKIYISFQILKD